jgi:hypothetical protein
MRDASGVAIDDVCAGGVDGERSNEGVEVAEAARGC